MSKIIFLNGASSSGKTSIARSIQYLSDSNWLTFGIDTFIGMTPYPTISKPDARYFSFVSGENDRGPLVQVQSAANGDQLFGVMPDFSKLLAAKGNDFIIDEVLLSDEQLKSYVKKLSGHTIYFIGVFCDLPVMQEREILTRDRSIGLSNDQIDRVHQGIRKYDLTVDTTSTPTFGIAQQILDFCTKNLKPCGFNKMSQLFK